MKLYLVALVLVGAPELSWAQTPAPTSAETNPSVREAFQAADNQIHQAAATDRAETTKRLAQDLIERYKVLAAQHPGNPAYTVLYARVLIGTNTPQAIELLKQVEGSPDDPWVHLTLAEIDSFGKFADHAQARTHLDAWFAVCPTTLNWNTISSLTRLGTSATIAKEAVILRAQLVNETAPYRLLSWNHVWNLEFNARPVPEHAVLRKQIAADVARLETIPAPQDPRWVALLATGYKLAGDPEAERRSEDRLHAGYPDISKPRLAPRERWYKEHPFPFPMTPTKKGRPSIARSSPWRTNSSNARRTISNA